MACYAQTVDVIGAIKTTKIAVEIETTGLVLALYRKRFERFPLELAHVSGPLDVVAAINEQGSRLTVGIVNPTGDSVALELDHSGASHAWCVTGPCPESHNAPGEPRAVDLTRLERAPGEPWTLPPWSCSVIELRV